MKKLIPLFVFMLLLLSTASAINFFNFFGVGQGDYTNHIRSFPVDSFSTLATASHTGIQQGVFCQVHSSNTSETQYVEFSGNTLTFQSTINGNFYSIVSHQVGSNTTTIQDIVCISATTYDEDVVVAVIKDTATNTIYTKMYRLTGEIPMSVVVEDVTIQTNTISTTASVVTHSHCSQVLEFGGLGDPYFYCAVGMSDNKIYVYSSESGITHNIASSTGLSFQPTMSYDASRYIGQEMGRESSVALIYNNAKNIVVANHTNFVYEGADFYSCGSNVNCTLSFSSYTRPACSHYWAVTPNVLSRPTIIPKYDLESGKYYYKDRILYSDFYVAYEMGCFRYSPYSYERFVGNDVLVISNLGVTRTYATDEISNIADTIHRTQPLTVGKVVNSSSFSLCYNNPYGNKTTCVDFANSNNKVSFASMGTNHQIVVGTYTNATDGTKGVITQESYNDGAVSFIDSQNKTKTFSTNAQVYMTIQVDIQNDGLNELFVISHGQNNLYGVTAVSDSVSASYTKKGTLYGFYVPAKANTTQNFGALQCISSTSSGCSFYYSLLGGYSAEERICSTCGGTQTRTCGQFDFFAPSISCVFDEVKNYNLTFELENSLGVVLTYTMNDFQVVATNSAEGNQNIIDVPVETLPNGTIGTGGEYPDSESINDALISINNGIMNNWQILVALFIIISSIIVMAQHGVHNFFVYVLVTILETIIFFVMGLITIQILVMLLVSCIVIVVLGMTIFKQSQ